MPVAEAVSVGQELPSLAKELDAAADRRLLGVRPAPSTDEAGPQGSDHARPGDDVDRLRLEMMTRLLGAG